MQKLATGANSPRSFCAAPVASCPRGFTLVEILVVVVIAGILTGTVLIGLGRSGPGQASQRELSRLSASLEVMCDQALLSGTARGLRFHAEGYDFWMHTPDGWQQLAPQDRPSAVRWPEGLRPRVEVENFAPGSVRNARAPQVICTGLEPPTGFVIELGSGDASRGMRWPR